MSVLCRLLAVAVSKYFTVFLFGLLFLAAQSVQAQSVSVTLAWDPPADTSGITEYRVYLRSAEGSYGSAYTSVPGASATSVTLNGIAPGSYFFVAKSFNGSLESSASNEVAVSAFVASLEALTANKLQGKSINFKAFGPGQSTALVTHTANANSSGMIVIPTGAAGLPATFDLLLDSPNYLAKRLSNRARTSTAALPALLSGDLDNSGTINSFDYGLMKSNWLSANALSDLNGDGIVNSLDYGFLKKNWFATDEL
jgi:hypothetical protein